MCHFYVHMSSAFGKSAVCATSLNTQQMTGVRDYYPMCRGDVKEERPPLRLVLLWNHMNPQLFDVINAIQPPYFSYHLIPIIIYVWFPAFFLFITCPTFVLGEIPALLWSTLTCRDVSKVRPWGWHEFLPLYEMRRRRSNPTVERKCDPWKCQCQRGLHQYSISKNRIINNINNIFNICFVQLWWIYIYI